MNNILKYWFGNKKPEYEITVSDHSEAYKHPCRICGFIQLNIPCAHCTHPNGDYFRMLTDDYVFNDRPKDCPMIIEELVIIENENNKHDE